MGKCVRLKNWISRMDTKRSIVKGETEEFGKN